ncbi:TetR/AcrR family transcriptional regulator [Arthrobacter sp. zg-Y859]|uniref:TetR/AcrR family transcriptional regulator n=1 Tax=Arthrobacter jinronghuae TaxID=2964609 RepID=A0ABT1NPB8_9MICC|nr:MULTISPECIES: TetR/AcrR family transcriptional regulator [Arthrobacter]MCC3290549.1 TetR/AcrR family transcriptional regulator [Arthrobacter sp. zg-Y1110]MCC3299939.1 TetR/AcrR family transcriptional regulator [Arthrobacter sp. zg-Y895]MCC9173050.1 TetR/AcrR family transcriptional regulator [Arthrobacter sp. zg-Y179]MCQ1949568.1 TetR/AcrR family transcriptional regulator [Arthrobacter jinronghuae]UWX77666.1 TetR/AcrR family transcriptional regulator [Arthrobacter jinronghuae]
MKTLNIKEELARTSVELFARHGYAKTSVQQIVDAAGVTKGALYHYFNSKDDLLFDIYDRILTLQREHLTEIIGRGLPAVETMRLVCEDVIMTSIDWIREGSVFFRSQHMLSEDRQEEVKRRRREYNEAFTALLVRGQSDGVFRTDIPIPVLAANFFSDPHYLSYWYSPGGSISREQAAAQLTDLYLAGLQAK